MTSTRPTAPPATAGPYLVPPGTLPTGGLASFATALADHLAIRINQRELWAAFARSFPRYPAGMTSRAWLLAALEDAERRGVIKLPPRHGRRWEHVAEPALPKHVTRIAETITASSEWRSWVWHPALAWVPTMTQLSEDEVVFLRRVHERLVGGTFARWAPLRHRSLVLTGNEKRLAALLTGRLFAPGRLTLELLGTEPDIPPLAWTIIRHVEQPRVLVFENSGPCDLAVRILTESARGAWDVVVYGGGRPFSSAVMRLRTLSPSAIAYVGDLDPYGVAIAQAADQAAQRCGLPRVVPAPGFHAAMIAAAIELGVPDGWLPDEERAARIRQIAANSSTTTWLPASVLPDFTRIAQRGHRIPEEVFGPTNIEPLLREGAGGVA